MNYWLLSLTLLNILLIAFIAFNQLAKNKASKEDNRLTRGLQLLQNKISILQDLSDKTDEQVRNWVHVIETKSSAVQAQLIRSDEKIIQIESALSKALDVSKIFYEQVPANEMAERQKTSKYVQAAKLANQGFSTDQISQKVDLSAAEIEMITKMNRDNLQFAEENLPAWIQAEDETQTLEKRSLEVDEFTAQLQRMNQMVTSTAFDTNKPDMTSMNQIKQQFTETLSNNSTQIPQTFLDENKAQAITRTETGKIVKPFEFRKIVK